MAFSALTSRVAAALDQAAAQATTPAAAGKQAKARATAQNFEAQFLSSMFQHMMTGIDGEGPFGGTTGVGVWRSFLTDEFAKSVAKKGGLGIADQIYSSLLSIQEAASNTSPH